MWVRSSIAFYGNFNLDMDRSPGFGSTPTDYFALFRLGFPSAPHLQCLTSPASVTRRTVLQKVRGSSYKDVPQLVNIWFQVLFHSPPPGSLFTFPSQYYALSVTKELFSLTGWFPARSTRFHVSRGTLDPASLARLSCTGLSPSLAGFPKTILLGSLIDSAVRTPECTHSGLGSSAFARRYLRNHMLFSLPPAT